MKMLTIPAGPEALSADWLTDALRSTRVLAKAGVAGFETEIVGAGAGFIGQLARVHLRYDAREEGAPASLIAKFPGASESGREIGNLFRFYEREICFYEQISHEVELATPRRYYSAMDIDAGEYVLLLEDLAPARVGDQVAACSIAEAELAIRSIADFHATWWESPRLDGLEWMPFVNAPVHQSAQQSYQEAWGPFIEQFGDRLSPEMRATGERIGRHVIDLLDLMEPSPRTIIHGDYRLDNLFFGDGDGRPALAVVDWQIASKGRGVFDVAYFLTGCLRPEVRKAHEMRLLRLWHDTLLARGVRGYDWEQALRDYRLCVAYCFTYVVISLGTLDSANERGVALFDAWLERSTAAIADNRSVELVPA